MFQLGAGKIMERFDHNHERKLGISLAVREDLPKGWNYFLQVWTMCCQPQTGSQGRHIMLTNESLENIGLPPLAGFSVDLKDNYSFPLRIASTDLRPDIVWWEDNPKKLWLVELTVPFETGFKEAAERKEAS